MFKKNFFGLLSTLTILVVVAFILISFCVGVFTAEAGMEPDLRGSYPGIVTFEEILSGNNPLHTGVTAHTGNVALPIDAKRILDSRIENEFRRQVIADTESRMAEIQAMQSMVQAQQRQTAIQLQVQRAQESARNARLIENNRHKNMIGNFSGERRAVKVGGR